MSRFLIGRKHRVRTRLANRQEFSNYKSTRVGVPSGSVSGPVLFDYDVNAVGQVFNSLSPPNVKLTIYADDHTIVVGSPNLE